MNTSSTEVSVSRAKQIFLESSISKESMNSEECVYLVSVGCKQNLGLSSEYTQGLSLQGPADSGGHELGCLLNFINFFRLLKFSSSGDRPHKQLLKYCREGILKKKHFWVMFFWSRTEVSKFSLTLMGACFSASPQHSKYFRENNFACQVLGLGFGWV